MRGLLCVALVVLLGEVAQGQTAPSLRSQLNLAAVRVSNPKSSASAFLLARPEGSPSPLVLITSAHVFEKADGDEMMLALRKREADQVYAKFEVPLKIRQGGKQLWVKHGKADVAALAVSVPDEAALPRLALDILATREDLALVEPGDLTRSFGFPHTPLFDPTVAAFPTVRLGCIASYPVVPHAKQETFLIDCNTFEGDSGAPVLWQPESHDKQAKIIGLIQGQHFINFNYDFPYESGEIRRALGVAIVIPAPILLETVEQLPKK